MAQGTMAWILENATKRVRYFRHRNGTIAPRMEQDSGVFEASPDYTEVQVVPVDAIVIRREDGLILSDAQADAIVRDRAGIVGRRTLREGDISHVEKNALIVLAAVRHLREHPPVDEEQVKALVALRDEWDASDSADNLNLWEFLVRHGVRVEAKS